VQARLRSFAQTLWRDTLRAIPTPLQPYALSLAALAALVGVAEACYMEFGPHLPPFLGGVLLIALLLVLLSAAWLEYGAGVLTCVLMTIIVPRLRPSPRRSLSRELFQLGLALIVSLLVSRIAQVRRRREAALRRTAEELEVRVREHSQEALTSALATREAEDRLRFVLDSADIGYIDYDIARNLSTRSLKHDQIFGFPDAIPHWNFRTLLDRVHPEDRRQVSDQLRGILTRGQLDIEFRILWPDGSLHWVWAKARCHRNTDGKPEHISAVIADITRRKLDEENLREQAVLLDLAHDAIISLDSAGAIQFWSQGAERMYGWTSDEAAGKVSHQLLCTEFPEPVDEIRHKLSAEGHWEGQLTHVRKDGAALKVSSRWAVRRRASGEIQSTLQINTDVTERLRIEEQLRHTQKLESLGVLAGGVAHDFNNLLTGILGNASLALDGVSEHNPQRQFLEEVMRASERAADLTRQLLAYAGKGRFIMRTVDLSAIVRDITGLVQASIAKTVQLRLQLEGRLPGIDADPGQLQQIVMNLVINGAEAIGPEGGSVLVITKVQEIDRAYITTMSSAGELLRPGAYVLLEVHDTGSGMSEETLARMFDPFYTTKFAGRGLGLSAVLGIVRSHKGAIKVYSKPGQGTTVKVLLPASVNPLTAPAAPFSGQLKGTGTVLVVDDEDVVRQTALHTLQRYGYEVVVASNGLEAVECYRGGHDAISLVLLDLTMPVMSGEETLVRLQTVNPGVRVLLTSGYNEVEALQRFAGKGLAGFIQKPYTATSLAEKVKSLIVR
jgi:PAS domain S-box-containing protein